MWRIAEAGTDRVHLLRLAVEDGRDEHPQTHEPGVLHLDADLGRPNTRIQDRQDVADASGHHAIRICVEPDLGGVPDVHARQVVLIDVAHDPDVREVRNREEVRRGVE